jgi:hypothetical protein
MSQQSNINNYFKKSPAPKLTTVDEIYKAAFENMERMEVESMEKDTGKEVLEAVAEGGKRKSLASESNLSDTSSKDSKRSRNKVDFQAGTFRSPELSKDKEPQRGRKTPPVPEQQSSNSSKEPIPDSESSEDEEEQSDDWETVTKAHKVSFPKADQEFEVISDRMTKLRFSMVVKYPVPLTVESQMISTFKKINSVLALITEEGRGKGWRGQAVAIPWQDDVGFSNRLVPRFGKKWFYDAKEKTFQFNRAKLYLSTFIHKWSAVSRKILDQEVGEPVTKWYDIQVGWYCQEDLFPNPPDKEEWAQLVHETSKEIMGFSLNVALTQVKNPVVAVQFLNSVINPAGDWMEEGHTRSLNDLKEMTQSLLGQKMEFGLSVRKIDCGSYGKQNPRVVTVTVDAPMVSKVQLELATIFSKENTKRNKIKDGVYTNWVAVPTFSSVAASREDTNKLTSYASLLAQEKSFQKMIRTITVKGIRVEHVDSQATDPRFHLTAECLSQMEDELIKQGITPIRRLLFDKVFKETKQKLIQTIIQSEHPALTQDPKALESQIKHISETVDFVKVAEQMNKDGVLSPFSTRPTPRPSKWSLRQMLLSLRARTYPGEKVMLFDSVTVTDEGELLLSFHSQVAEEAQTVAELLPCFIQHEMHIDPQFFCLPSLLQENLGSVYNPITRKGFLSKFKNTILEEAPSASPRNMLPEFCREFSAEDLVRVFKCSIFEGAFPSSSDDDLISLAQSIVTSPPVRRNNLSVNQMEQFLNEAKIIQTVQMDEMSGLSGNSFDSKTSQNAYYIEERAMFKVKDKFMRKLADLINDKEFEAALVTIAVGDISLDEFQQNFPDEASKLAEFRDTVIGGRQGDEGQLHTVEKESKSRGDKDLAELILQGQLASAMAIVKEGYPNWDQFQHNFPQEAACLIQFHEMMEEDNPQKEAHPGEQDEDMSDQDSISSVNSEATDKAGSPSKGTGVPNPGSHN